ncbi:MAG TPA: GAF domain-containing protein, partial [Fimbriimonadaceae bacterium]|nr:GAF domain-containing protein [Fimbriimonadaceae bacterium]
MVASQDFNELLSMVTRDQEADSALGKLNRAALEMTGSRNAMIARLNDELGVLELRHGLGEEWSKGQGEQLQVGTSDENGIVAYVAATGRTFISNDVLEEPLYKNVFGTTRSEIAVPVRDCHGRIRAVLNVESDRAGAYGDGAVQTCEGIAMLASIVLDREDASMREEALIQIGSALDRAVTEDELIDSVIRVAGDVLRFQAFSIFLHDPRTDTFVLRGSVGRLKSQVGQLRYDWGEGCTGWVCEHGQSIPLENPQSDPRWGGRHVEFAGEEIAAFLAVPVVFRGKCVGALRVVRRVSENKFLDNRFNESDERVMVAIAEQFATAIENIRNLDQKIRSERMVAWGELSAKSSHMIGNRVFALKGDVNELRHLLTADNPDLRELREIQKSLNTNVQRIEEILQDFRDFVTATQIVKESTDINNLVEETVKEVFPRRSQVHLVLELDGSLPPAAVDDKRLRRAISELIENSMNYMDEGRMRVATSIADGGSIQKARVVPGKKYVRIEIEDTG